MKPTRLQYALARGFILSTCASALLMAGIVAWRLLPTASLLPGLPLSFWLYFLFACFTALPLGWMFGALLIWPFVESVASKVNGAPFHEGESVRVLSGPHRDRVLELYEIWHERHQVRAWLGEQPGKDVTDVFDYHQICRASESGDA